MSDIVYSGYTKVELEYGFSLVENKDHWKLPVDAYVSIDNVDLACAAVEFFTGSVADVIDVGGGYVRIRAEGYYQAIGC